MAKLTPIWICPLNRRVRHFQSPQSQLALWALLYLDAEQSLINGSLSLHPRPETILQSPIEYSDGP